jgi:ferredoxin
MLASIERHFTAAGRRRFLHVERFRAALTEVPADAAGGRVVFRAGGTEVTADADATTPLLRVAEDAGLNPAHGCRMGICHSCDVPLTAGCVRDLRTGELIDEPGRTVQICISAAAGDCELALRTADERTPSR